MGNFKFTGNMIFPKADAVKPFVKIFSGGENKKTPMACLNLGIKASDNNLSFVEMFGSVQNTIKTMNSNNEKIEIDWDNRFDASVIKEVVSYRKHIIDLGEGFERKEFISPYDAILYLKDALGQYKGKILVTGQWIKQPYKGKFYDKFLAQNFYAVTDDTKCKLSVTVDIYYNKNSIDDKDFKTEKCIYLDGYIKQYIGKDEGNKYIPQQFVLDGSKMDFNNEKHVSLFNYRKKYMTTDKKTVVHMLWDVNYLNGAEEIEFDESQLTKAQKEQVELGLATVDSFKPKGNIFGNRVSKFRLIKPNLTGDFSDGIIDTELSLKEFEDEVYVFNATEERLDDVIKETENKKTETEVKIDDDDLFS
jgi:hypothetical protein